MELHKINRQLIPRRFNWIADSTNTLIDVYESGEEVMKKTVKDHQLMMLSFNSTTRGYR